MNESLTNVQSTPIATDRKLVPFGGLNIGDTFFSTFAGKEYRLTKSTQVDAILTVVKGDGDSKTIETARKPYLHHESVEIENGN